jgi:xylan 1,4-beta-xylosidase
MKLYSSLLSAAACLSLTAHGAELPARRVCVDMARSSGPLDRSFDLSVGSDFPGTLMRADSQAQLKLAVNELGFRYIRFHAIFHDVLGTVRVENRRVVYDWSKIDQL